MVQLNLRALQNVFSLGTGYENITKNQYKRKVELRNNCFVVVFADVNDDSTLEQSIYFIPMTEVSVRNYLIIIIEALQHGLLLEILAPHCVTKKSELE